MNEYLLSVNKYNTPTVLQGKNAICVLLLRLLLLQPGTIQSRPEMGVGVTTKWRYIDMDNLDDLKLDIETQISTYLPNIAVSEISVEQSQKDNKEIIIKVVVDEIIYAYETIEGDLKLYDLITDGGN